MKHVELTSYGAFSQRSGTEQGRLLLCLLFHSVLELLATVTRQEKRNRNHMN